MLAPFAVSASDGLVEAWSIARLQFEPRGWQRDLRAELRDAVSGLTITIGPLAAQYRSPVRDSCDTENILFYNVGTGSFATACASGVRFERGFDVPACPVALESDPRHYHRYELANGADGPFQLWRRTATLACFDSVLLPRISANSKPAGVWLALHRGAVAVAADGVRSGPFALRLRLRLPDGYGAPISLLKPLLDGIIAAFGVYQGFHLDLVAERIAEQLDLDTPTIAGLLTNDSRAVLGACLLAVPRAAGVQWQPADDRCVACHLLVERIGDSAARLDGELLAVSER